MATIPIYQRRFGQDGSAPITRTSGADPIGAAMQNIGQAGERMAGTAMQIDLQAQEKALREQDKAKREAENVDKVQTSNLLSNGDVYWQQREDERRRAWKVGDPDMREAIGKDFDKWVEESSKGLTTDEGKQYFRQHTDRMRARLLTDAYTFQSRSTTSKLNADSAAGEDADEILVSKSWRDPNAVNEIITRRIEPLLARTDLDEAEKVKQAGRIKQRMLLARERAFVENDPEGWLRENGTRPKPAPAASASAGAGGAAVGFDAVIEKVLKVEGGYNAVDGNSGAPVNFGINQRANPDIDVKNLTREGAIKIYRERYWNAIGADNLPGAMQATAMDAAVNQGVGWTRQALAEANGDVLRFNELRRQRYRDIAKDPEQKRYLATWLKRVEDPAPGGGAAAPESAAAPSEPTGWAANNLDPDSLYKLRSLAETRAGQQSAQYRAEASRLVSDYMAGHKDGKVEQQALTPEYFDRAFGADGARAYGEYRQSRQMGEDIASFRDAPIDQIQAAIAASEPQPGEGYAAADARSNTRRQAAAAVLKQREDDPAGYAAMTSPRVRSLVQQAATTQDPEQRRLLNEQLVDSSLAEQRRLGVQNPRILTPGQADHWQAQAMKAARPEDSANLIAALESEYGRNFSAVFAELARGGKISGELLIIPNLPSQAAREAVSRLARVKESDLAGVVSADQQREVKTKAQDALVDLVRTVPFLTDQSAGAMSNYEQMLRKMAYEQIGAGASASEAVEKARTLLLGHYEFKDSVRYPKGLNIRAMRSSMDDVLGKDLGDIDIPSDVAGARTPDEVRSAFTEMVQARPLWHTTDDDRGVRLFIVREDGLKMPITKGGRPLTYTWEQLQAMQNLRAPVGSGAREIARQNREASRGRIESTRPPVEPGAR